MRPRWTKLPRLYRRARGRTRRFEVPIRRNSQCEAVRRRIPLSSVAQAPNRRIRSRWRKAPRLYRRALRRTRRFEGLILRIRNIRRPTTASDGTRVHKRQSDVCGHGGPSYLAYIGGPEGVLACLRSQFGEIRNARQSAAVSHSAQLPKHQTDVYGYGG